jgi:23S rRNA pseudouridine2605 synthase
MAEDGNVRLQRFLAMSGVASRRKSEDLIAAGLVSVNGRTVTQPGTTVDPDRDRVAVGGKVVRPRAVGGEGASPVVALHKPRGYLSARAARGGEPTVYELVDEPAGTRMIYVGRLDRDSEGLLLFTTDGTLAHRLTHPRWEVERTYEAWIVGPLDERRLQQGARRGVILDDGERTAPFRARILGRERAGHARRVELVLTEGRKREVRRIVSALGGRVERLVRTRYGTVELEGLAPGAWRRLSRDEVARLRALVGLESGERRKGPEVNPVVGRRRP